MWFNHNLQKNTGGNLDRLSHVTIMYNCVNENDPLSPRNRTDGPAPDVSAVASLVRSGQGGAACPEVERAEGGDGLKGAARAVRALLVSLCVNHFTHTHTKHTHTHRARF